jgi:excisionase family DNA binding protein
MSVETNDTANEALALGSARPSGPAMLRLLTLSEVAKFLAISERSVKRLVGRRGLRCVRIGRSVRFDPSDVRRWVEARKE